MVTPPPAKVVKHVEDMTMPTGKDITTGKVFDIFFRLTVFVMHPNGTTPQVNHAE